MAVEHFDEAVYASNLLFPPEAGGEYPFRQLYAPPLLPAVIEWTTIFGQTLFGSVPTWWPMLPGLLCGLATIPSVWWIARSWFSPRAGVAAAFLIAGNEYHAAYSRTALTDVPLSLFVLWAVFWFWRGLSSGSPRQAILAGGFTALAWWTKYNGWLPLAIAAAGGVAWQISTPPSDRNWVRMLRGWLIAAGTAAILWSPVLWDCQKVGGYSEVAANHQHYVDGFANWGVNLWRGLTSLGEFVGPGTVLGLVLAVLSWQLLPRPTDRADNRTNRALAAWLVMAWFWGLTVATPLYFPYPRLWAPWVLSGCLALGAGLPFRDLTKVRNLSNVIRGLLMMTGVLFALALAVGTNHPLARITRLPVSLESRRQAWNIAEQIQQTISDSQAPVFVHSEPAIWYHLRQRQQPALIADGLTFLDRPRSSTSWLVIGPQGLRDLEQTTAWKEALLQLELAGEYEFKPSHIALLDSLSPDELREDSTRQIQRTRLYRVRP